MMHISLLIGSVLILVVSAGAFAVQPDAPIAPFEASSYGNWSVTGAAFGEKPSRGALPGEPMFLNHVGDLLANSFANGDESTGELRSPQFTITRRYLKFTLGGAGYFDKAGVSLVVDGMVVRSESVQSPVSPNYETIEDCSWDVGDLSGKQATLRIFDQIPNGHVIAGNFILTDNAPPPIAATTSRDVRCDNHWLYVGAKIGATIRRVALTVDGKVQRDFLLEVANDKPDWYASVDISSWKAKTILVSVDRLPESTRFFAHLQQGDKIWTGRDIYREPLRPVFHATPLYGWNNDVVGPVYYKGEYHVFFEYSPYAPLCDGAKVFWGHMVSKDLAHWTHLPPALSPDETGSKWSGGSVVDWKNASGLGTASNPPLVLVYTAAKDPFTVGLASSTDGRTFTQYDGNPVLPNINHANRDPHVFWDEATGRFIMAFFIGSGFPDVPGSPRPGPRERIQLLTSPDLKHWTPTSTVDVDPECPDLYQVAVDGNPAIKKWVIAGANGTYKLGEFDGQVFHEETPNLPGYQGDGGSYYASQTFNDLPDDRTIQMGWIRAAAPGMPFTQCMSVPLEIGLLTTPDGPRLTHWPASELNKLHTGTVRRSAFELAPGTDALKGTTGEALDIALQFEPGDAAAIDLDVRGVPIHYDCKRQLLTVGALKERYVPMRNGRQNLRILADRTCYEVFACDGLWYAVLAVVPDPENRYLSLTSSGGSAKVRSLDISQMQSIW